MKTALKRAKLAAAKAKQDLTEELSTTTDTDAKPPDLDVVNASMVRILRKFDPPPVLSPALPVLQAHVVQATIPKAPPVTVIIPAQPFDPLPVQLTADTLSANLTVPTIHSCLSYERIPIKFVYLIDVEDWSSEDELKTHIELLSENRRRRRRLAGKIKELDAKDKNLKAKKPEEQYRHNVIDQKHLQKEGFTQHVP